MGKNLVAITDEQTVNVRFYEIDSKSAKKAAELFGRCAGGEVITVFAGDTIESDPVSQVTYTIEGNYQNTGIEQLQQWFPDWLRSMRYELENQE